MKDKAGDFFSREDFAEQRRAKRRRRERNKAVLVMLGGLVAMVAVLYVTVTVCVWMDRNVQTNAGGIEGSSAGSGGAPGSQGQDGGNGGALGSDGNAGQSPEGDGSSEGNGDVAVDAMNNARIYSQAELDHQVASAREQAAADVLKYHFVPINRQLKQNQWKQENLEILESGEFRYLQDGNVISHKGIDVSRHQGEIDWPLVAQDGVEFAFIRVGYRGYGSNGTLVEDDRFEENIKGAIDAGIKVGVYFYSQAITEEEVIEEAELVLEKIAPYQIDCPVVFDVERVAEASGRMNGLSVEERTRLTEIFCQKIADAGYRPMIYYNTEMGALMLGIDALEGYEKWFASYSEQLYYPYEYKVWQYSQSGSVQGINGAVDLNISFVPLWEE